MSRLPSLERALFEAAERMDAQAPASPARRRRWRSTPLLAGLASLVIAGAALATATGLLDDGARVPPTSRSPLPAPVDDAKGFTLASVRAPDPDGGPEWGIGTYDATPGATTCVVIGRVQNGRLGVVGRDGVFGDDGRFHELSPAAQSSGTCGGRAKDGTFTSFSLMPPIPASGYTGAPGTSIGGCRERVDLDGPTVSPQTRRKLRGVPECAVASLRRVVAGFAGPSAASATLTAPGYRKTLTLDPKDGAYLFVVPSASTEPPQLTITNRDGTVCRPLAKMPC
jgi:hypothetical protein